MATIEIHFDDEKIHDLLGGDDVFGALMQGSLNDFLQAEMTEHVGAERGERTEKRLGHRNGSYRRGLTTRVGRLELEVPRDRKGTFSTELFARYQRSEKALVLALMEMVVQGVSTRRVKKITERLCGRAFSKSTVSRLCEQLDARVEAWAERPLGGTTYPFLMVDAMHVKVRRQGAVRSTTVMLAIGVNEEGYREILGIDLSFKETGEAWADFLQQLRDRGLRGVEFAASDAHEGLAKALRERFPGAVWQRCQAHFRRNVSDETPETHRDELHRWLDRILEADSPEEAREALTAAQEALGGKADRALEKLESGFEDATAVLSLPQKYRRRLRTTNSVERYIEEIRRREKVIRIFPNVRSAWRLIGARCAEQHEEWSTGKRYFNMDGYYAWKRSFEDPAPIARAA